MNTAFLEYLEQFIPKENIAINEPMSRHTTFRIGGDAAVFITVAKEEELIKLVSYLYKTEREFFVLGNGSNLLVGDRGYDGVVVHLGKEYSQITVTDNAMEIQAGALLSAVAKKAMEHGLSGLEFASGIPGTMGGAVVMNAGAYDGEMKQVVREVHVIDKQGEILVLDNDTMEFGYRTSILKNRPFVVSKVVLTLGKDDPENISVRMAELSKKRREKQPMEYPSAGSTFKRPENYFAGKLIMDAGLRGFRIGGAQVSEKHCGFVINKGNAMAADVREVIAEIQERVKRQYGVELEPEVIFLGKF